MAFPQTLTNAQDDVTVVDCSHLNNLEAKVGVDGSGVTSSLDYLLKNSASKDPGHLHSCASLMFDKARMWLNGSISLAFETWTVIPFDTILYDTNSICTTGSGAKIMPKKPGYYNVIGSIIFNLNNNGWVQLVIYKNGSIAARFILNNATTGGCTVIISDLIYCNGSTDYLQIAYDTNQGGGLNNGNPFDNYMTVLGPF